MYARVAVWATRATPLPMWGVEGSGMALLPNMITDFRDNGPRLTASVLSPFMPLVNPSCLSTCALKLARQPSFSKRTGLFPSLFPLLTLGVGPRHGWTLPYMLACTAKSPFHPKAYCRCGCCQSLPPDPPLYSMSSGICWTEALCSPNSKMSF
jgi:hypothetical protein